MAGRGGTAEMTVAFKGAEKLQLADIHGVSLIDDVDQKVAYLLFIPILLIGQICAGACGRHCYYWPLLRGGDVMNILNEEQMDIFGFSGVRERVLLLDRQTFTHLIPDECWDGFGNCVYLANAWFVPGGSTGMHHHAGMDIVSVIPRGRILHEGSMGDGCWVAQGQVQLQRDGASGIRHNESNPSAEVQPMMQVWIRPQPPAAEAQYQIIDLAAEGLTCVYGGALFEAAMQVEILQLPAAAHFTFSGDDYLLYIFRGSALLTEGAEQQPVHRGDMIRVSSFTIQAEQELGMMVLQQTLQKNPQNNPQQTRPQPA